MTLNLFTFNNYYNRIIKRYDTINEYAENGELLHIFTDRNFNPNDGVSTTAIFNYRGTQPDYCVVTNEYNEIDSRWYVIEAVRTTGGQYMVTLYRDLVSDYYTTALYSPCFIEKATLGKNDPFIFNKENMTYNQVRTNLTLLKDASKVPWIVGYVPLNSDLGKISADIQTNVPADIEVADITNWAWYDYTDMAGGTLAVDSVDNYLEINSSFLASWWAGIAKAQVYKGKVKVRSTSFTTSDFTLGDSRGLYTKDDVAAVNQTGSEAIYGYLVAYGNNSGYTGSAVTSAEYLAKQITNSKDFATKLSEYTAGLINKLGYDDSVAPFLRNLNNKIIHDQATDKYYRIDVKTDSTSFGFQESLASEWYNIIKGATSSFTLQQFNLFEGVNATRLETVWTSVPFDEIKLKANLKFMSLKLNELNYSVSSTIRNMRALSDAPYRMFCIPYGPITCINSGGSEFTANATAGLGIAVNITDKEGEGDLYDAQLLPYCPIPEAITADGKLDLRTQFFDLINTEEGDVAGSPVNAICWCYRSSFTFNINDYKIPIGSTALDRKINSETVMYRLCSPNGSGQFELDAEMNNGVSSWEVNCTYKPFQPFIQVKPVFGGLYGIETETDYRGLICGGDFSIPRLKNAWADYQLQNKNFQEIFDREVQNLKVNQQLQRAQQVFGGVTSVATGAARGAASGGIIGALTGAATAGMSSMVNIGLSEVGRQETLDYKNDMFGFQLGNIQAIPSSISKTAANVINNPLIPYLEKYESTPEEVMALKNKIKYNGMTVGRIGTISEFIQPQTSYIKAKLIRAEGIADDFHVVNALASELDKGVFL